MPSKVKYFYELTVSSSPHVHGPNRTGRLMLDVILALLPALVGAVVSFGPRVLLVCGLSVAACVFFEWGYRKVMKLDNTVRDLSAVVTGLLLAFVCPVTIPYWTILVGDFFAIIIVKQLFGGIGKNFMNPALAARAFLFSWPVIMTTWVQPGDWAPLFGSSADAVTSATPLASLHQSALPAESLMSLFLGKTGGCLGETSALLLCWAACTWSSGAGSSVCGFPLLIWVPWPFSPCSFPGGTIPFCGWEAISSPAA